ncbi:MAG: acyltransferase [Paucibacter sp.]|nr:acyltransferase [Roseateles sp.]
MAMLSGSGSVGPVPAGTDRARVDYLDGWRGLAILLLLVGHFRPIPGLELGTLGVSLFFVLSGLLMGRLLFVENTPIVVFYRRRISRIIPAHLVFVLLVVAVTLALGRAFSGREVLAAALFVNNYFWPTTDTGEAVMPFGHIWSLSVEEHAYILLATLALVSRHGWIGARTALLGATAVCTAVTAFYAHWNPPGLVFTWWLRSETAAYGIVLSALLLVVPLPDGRSTRRLAAAAPLLLLAAVACFWWSVPLFLQRIAGLGLLALSLHLLPLGPAVLRRCLAWPPLCRLGKWSFSIYLWQQPFYIWVRNEQGSLWLGIAGALLAGLLSYALIEKPVRRWLNANWAALPA